MFPLDNVLDPWYVARHDSHQYYVFFKLYIFVIAFAFLFIFFFSSSSTSSSCSVLDGDAVILQRSKDCVCQRVHLKNINFFIIKRTTNAVALGSFQVLCIWWSIQIWSKFYPKRITFVFALLFLRYVFSKKNKIWNHCSFCNAHADVSI